MLADIFNNLHSQKHLFGMLAPLFMHPDGLRGALVAAADTGTEYAVACGLVLSAVLGFFVDWDDSFSYDRAEGIAYAVCISPSTCLLKSFAPLTVKDSVVKLMTSPSISHTALTHALLLTA